MGGFEKFEDVFVQLGHAEHLGTGVKNIFNYTKLYTGQEPKLDDEDLYNATIPLPPEMEPIVRETKAYKEPYKAPVIISYTAYLASCFMWFCMHYINTVH